MKKKKKNYLFLFVDFLRFSWKIFSLLLLLLYFFVCDSTFAPWKLMIAATSYFHLHFYISIFAHSTSLHNTHSNLYGIFLYMCHRCYWFALNRITAEIKKEEVTNNNNNKENNGCGYERVEVGGELVVECFGKKEYKFQSKSKEI